MLKHCLAPSTSFQAWSLEALTHAECKLLLLAPLGASKLQERLTQKFLSLASNFWHQKLEAKANVSEFVEILSWVST